MKLRPYQEQAVASAIQHMEAGKSTLIVMATGLGKTVTFAHIANHFSGRGRVKIIAHREELIRQAADKIGRVTGHGPEVEMASEWADKPSMYRMDQSKFIVSSVQTQISGMNGKGRMTRFNPADFSLLVIDEAHHATAASYRKLLAYYRQNKQLAVLGVTATPDRCDNEALGQVFDTVAFDYGIEQGIADGWLAPIRQRMVNVEGLDFSAVGSVAGDLNQGHLADLMELERNLHAIAHPTYEISAGRKTLLFCASVSHAERIAEILNRHEPAVAQVVTGTTPAITRQRILREYKYGGFRFLCNCGVFTEGFDEPGIEVVAVARPTKSRSLYAQMVGRGTRPLEGIVDGVETADSRRSAIDSSPKRYLEVIDFVGNSGRHKLVSVADILGGKYSELIISQAKAHVLRSGGSHGEDMTTMLDRLKLEQEQRDEARRSKLDAEARKRAALRAKATYATTDVDPFSRLRVVPCVIPPWHRGRMSSDKQAALLRRNGVRDPEKLNFAHASQLIAALVSQWQAKKGQK